MKIPLTKTNFTARWGNIVNHLDGTMTVHPRFVVSNPESTSAGLAIWKSSLVKPVLDFKLVIEATLMNQLRKGTPPNPWECFAVAFNWHLRLDEEKDYANILWHKTNGVQLSTASNEIDEEFPFEDAPGPKAVVGKMYKYVLQKRGNTFKASINGRTVFNVNSSLLVNKAGFLGIYAEDAKVKIHSFDIEILK